MATKNKFRQVLFHIETVPIAVYCEARSTITNYKFACHSCGQPSSNVVSGTELLIHRVHFA